MKDYVFHVVLLVCCALAHFVLGNEECDLYFRNLTNAISSTYLCFGEFGQPMSICSRCFCNITTLELLLNDSVPKNDFGVPCRFFIEQEILVEPWIRIISPIRKIWQNAHCNQCLIEPNSTYNRTSFPNDGAGSSLPNYNLSAYNGATRRFFDQITALSECIANHTFNSNASFLDQINFPTEPSIHINKSVCLRCRQDYDKLYSVYQSWVRQILNYESNRCHHPLETAPFRYDKLCADVVDALNRTQFVWLGVLDCSNPPDTKSTIVLLPLIIYALAAAAFHAAMLCVFHRPSRVIVYMQSRVETVTDTMEGAPVIEEPNARGNHHFNLFHKTSFAPMTRRIPCDTLNTVPPNTSDL
ncbi:unnamed protein product [Hydatigera taeniaeformis]|uniref:Osteopetrosis-associated transmembrane protein 1 n=1 Tax=Hydatigena taeniaeformis TaxID=6205 RepID=A0A0R3WZS2_HYDTA|nr:unnamed protein product [Hydatigera taeniaeformis]